MSEFSYRTLGVLILLTVQIQSQAQGFNRIIAEEGIAGLKRRILEYRSDPSIEAAGRRYVETLGPAGCSECGDPLAWLHSPDMSAGGGPLDVSGKGLLRNNSIIGGQANRIASDILRMSDDVNKIEWELLLKQPRVREKMNDSVGALIDSFRRAKTVGLEAAGKIDCIHRLARLNDVRVGSFLVQVAGDSTEYDLARIEALRILELGDLNLDRESVVHMISKVLQCNEDHEVRSFAARALAGVIGVPRALEIALNLVMDSNEDEDIRHNAFFAIERGMPAPEAVAAMRSIRNSPDFGIEAERVLERFRERRI